MKKMLSLMLVIALCITLFTGCKKDVRADFFEDLEKSQNLEIGQISFEFHINVPKEEENLGPLVESIENIKEKQDIFIKVNMEIQSKNPLKLKLDIYYKDTAESEYVSLTDILIDDKDYYINLNSLKDFIINAEFLNDVDEANEIRLLLGNMNLNYLKINKEELLGITETYITAGDTKVSINDENMNYDLTKDLLLKVFLNTFKEIENSYEKTLVKYEEKTYKIELDATLIRDIYKKIETIVNRDIDKIADELLAANYRTDIPEDIIIKRDELVKEIKSEANRLSTIDISDNANMRYQFKFDETKNGEYKSNHFLSLLEDETILEISFKTTDILNEIGYVIPENFVTTEQLIQQIMMSFTFVE